MLARGVLTGGLAAAATAGALLGFGIRDGRPARPFNAIASLFAGDRLGDIWGFHPVVTIAGLLATVAIVVGWGVLFARLAGELRGTRLAGAALVAGVAALALHVLIGGRLLGPGLSDVLSPAQVVLVHVVLGVALGVGMRLATSYLWSE